MSNIIVPVAYFRLRCNECGLQVETRGIQYHQCPGCHSRQITSARAERMEAYEAPKSQQKDANQVVKKMLEKVPS